MRLLLVTPYFPPQPAIASRRVHAHATTWAKAGHDVTVLTTAKRLDQRGLDLPCENIEVVEIPFEVPRVLARFRAEHKSRQFSTTPVEAKSIGLRSRFVRLLLHWRDSTGVFSSVRMPDLTDYWVAPALEWFNTQRDRRWDVMISSCGPYTAHLVARVVRHRGGSPLWIAEFRDLWTENHLHHGLFPFTLRERMLESKCLREVDMLVTVSESLASRLRRRSKSPVEIIYNGFDPATLAAISHERIFPRDDLFRMVYTGTLYAPEQGFDPKPLLQAIARLRQSNEKHAARIRLVVAGQGGETWAKLAAAFRMQDIIDIRGLVSADDALRMQRDADALLLLDHADATQGVLSGKVFEYLAASAPILVIGGAHDSPMGQLVDRARRGWNLMADGSRIEKLILELMKQPALTDSSLDWSGDREHICQFSRERQSLALLDRVQALRTAH